MFANRIKPPKKKYWNCRFSMETVMVGTGPAERPANPRPVCEYTTFTFAGVIDPNMLHIPAV